MSQPIIFSGAVNMTSLSFAKHYAQHVTDAVAAGKTIRVGCADGCDRFVQDQCVGLGYENVEVYIPSEAKEKDIYCASDKFRRIVVEGGFKRRDRAMWEGCVDAYARLSQYAGAGSGAAANVIACAARAGQFGPQCTELDGYAVVELLRHYSAEFSPTLQKKVLAEEESGFRI